MLLRNKHYRTINFCGNMTKCHVHGNMTNWNYLHLMDRPVIFDGYAEDSNIIKASIQVCSERKDYDPGQDRDNPKQGYKCEFLYLGYSTRQWWEGNTPPPTPPLSRGWTPERGTSYGNGTTKGYICALQIAKRDMNI